MIYKIRKADLADLDVIQRLNHKLFELEFAHFDNNLQVGWALGDAGAEYFRLLLAEQFVYAAEVDKEVIGYLAGSIDKGENYTLSKEAELNNMFIEKKYRGYGIGKELVDAFKKDCERQGVGEIKVTASYANRDAIAFYHKLFFNDKDLVLACNLKRGRNDN